jgi:hypothetical protein
MGGGRQALCRVEHLSLAVSEIPEVVEIAALHLLLQVGVWEQQWAAAAGQGGR